MGKEEKQTFEQATKRIDEIVGMLEKGDAELDKSLALFEEGVKLVQQCGTMLDNAEQIVMKLQKSGTDENESGQTPKEYLFDEDE